MFTVNTSLIKKLCKDILFSFAKTLKEVLKISQAKEQTFIIHSMEVLDSPYLNINLTTNISMGH